MVNGVAGEPRRSLTLSAVSQVPLAYPIAILLLFETFNGVLITTAHVLPNVQNTCISSDWHWSRFILFSFLFLIRGSPGFGSLLFLFCNA